MMVQIERASKGVNQAEIGIKFRLREPLPPTQSIVTPDTEQIGDASRAAHDDGADGRRGGPERNDGDALSVPDGRPHPISGVQKLDPFPPRSIMERSPGVASVGGSGTNRADWGYQKGFMHLVTAPMIATWPLKLALGP